MVRAFSFLKVEMLIRLWVCRTEWATHSSVESLHVSFSWWALSGLGQNHSCLGGGPFLLLYSFLSLFSLLPFSVFITKWRAAPSFSGLGNSYFLLFRAARLSLLAQLRDSSTLGREEGGISLPYSPCFFVYWIDYSLNFRGKNQVLTVEGVEQASWLALGWNHSGIPSSKIGNSAVCAFCVRVFSPKFC